MRLEQLGQLPQQLVSGRVTTGIIDDLELIEIHIAQHLVDARARPALQRLGHPPLELLAVDQAGQGVMGCLMGQFERQPAVDGHIAKGQHRANDVPFGIADRRHRILHRHFAAIAPAQLVHAAGRAAQCLPVTPQHGADRIEQFFSGAFIEQAIHLIQRFSCRISLAPASQLFRYRVEVAHARIGTGGNHAVADRRQGHLRQHLLLKQLLLDTPTLGDITDHAGIQVVLQ